MGINTRFEKASDATYSAPSTSGAKVVITWTANEPTAGVTQTIADGDVPTVAELGQYVANANAQIDNLVDDVAALKAALAQLGVDSASILSAVNAGE